MQRTWEDLLGGNKALCPAPTGQNLWQRTSSFRAAEMFLVLNGVSLRGLGSSPLSTASKSSLFSNTGPSLAPGAVPSAEGAGEDAAFVFKSSWKPSEDS
ncbi:hypothetical protein EYF80_036232 [Liparis tanakae]|uniref:Uncharacterized protein n=1 Tax=Liparis tanakae TaxID=230148 RepID=A0A4Z2GLL4_9TELE|nr:hypothetical protein EYF80_036232 [Liparis tanakae]